jgi:hypothetical protein
VTERLFLFSKYFSQNGEKIKSWALPTLLGASLVSFLCSWTGIICLCLSYVVVVGSLCNHLIFPFVSWSLLCSSSSVWIRYKEEGARPSTRYAVVFFPNSTLHSFSLNVVWLACLTPLSCASLHLNRFYAISESLSFFRRPYIGVIDRKCRGFDRSEM